jgi:alpha-L-rhamnosidase
VLEFLVRDILENNEGHLNTGIYGTKFLLEYLSQNGYHDVAFGMVRKKDFPGWGYMLANGATTLWETWAYSNNTYSHNHPMMGSVSGWFYRYIGGIRPAPGSEGFNRIILSPSVDSPLTWVKCSYHSILGEITSNWEKSDGELKIHVHIPVGATASIYLPAGGEDEILENGLPLSDAAGIEFQGIADGRMVCRLVSGSYYFTMPAPEL